MINQNKGPPRSQSISRTFEGGLADKQQQLQEVVEDDSRPSRRDNP